MAFYKFLNDVGAISFMKGNMLFRNIDYYRELEEDESIGRVDICEGTFCSDNYTFENGNKIRK